MNNKTKRTYSNQFKTNLVLQYLSGEKSQAEICRENNINSNLLSKWRHQFLENAHKIFELNKHQNKDSATINKLQQIIGKQTVEIDFLKRGLAMFS